MNSVPRRIGTAFGAVLAVLASVGPASMGTAQAQQKIRVAADVGYAPHVMLKPTGGFEGYNVDLAQAIAKKLGYELEIIDQQWSGIFAGLNAKRYAFIISPTTITEERARNMLFTEPYLDNDYGFLIKKGAPQVAGLDDLKSKVIAVNKGNLYDKWASEREGEYRWSVLRFDKNADAIAAVIGGRATANLSGSTVVGYVAKQNPMIVPSTYAFVTGQGMGLAFRTDDTEMRNKVELVLECLKKDGTVARIHEQWTGTPPRKDGSAHVVHSGFGAEGFPGYDPAPHENLCG